MSNPPSGSSFSHFSPSEQSAKGEQDYEDLLDYDDDPATPGKGESEDGDQEDDEGSSDVRSKFSTLSVDNGQKSTQSPPVGEGASGVDLPPLPPPRSAIVPIRQGRRPVSDYMSGLLAQFYPSTIMSKMVYDQRVSETKLPDHALLYTPIVDQQLAPEGALAKHRVANVAMQAAQARDRGLKEVSDIVIASQAPLLLLLEYLESGDVSGEGIFDLVSRSLDLQVRGSRMITVLRRRMMLRLFSMNSPVNDRKCYEYWNLEETEGLVSAPPLFGGLLDVVTDQLEQSSKRLKTISANAPLTTNEGATSSRGRRSQGNRMHPYNVGRPSGNYDRQFSHKTSGQAQTPRRGGGRAQLSGRSSGPGAPRTPSKKN